MEIENLEFKIQNTTDMATTVKARGQITIVDLNDAKQVQTYIENDGADVQIYNPDTKVYTPNFSTNPITLTARVFVSGEASDQMQTKNVKDPKWYVDGKLITSSSGGYQIDTDPDGSKWLKITGNITGNALQIKFEAKYLDPDTQQETKLMAFKTITKSSSAGALFQVVITAPSGTIFANGAQTATLTAKAAVYRGGTKDTGGTTFTWEYLDISEGTWKALAAGDSAATANNESTLTVKAANVLNFQTYRCKASDDGNQAEAYITFQDLSDPYRVEVYSETGSTIVNGADNTVVKARVWQGANIVEDASTNNKQFTYTWTLFNSSGTKVNFKKQGTETSDPATRTGNPITLLAADVQTRATVFCEVSK